MVKYCILYTFKNFNKNSIYNSLDKHKKKNRRVNLIVKEIKIN